MTYQTTYVVPWTEAHLMTMFDKCDTVHLVKEDTQGRIYRTEVMYVDMKGSKADE